MLYSLTEKLKFEDNPQIEIKDTVLTVKADAETVLSLLDVVNSKGDVQGSLDAMHILFSESDQKKIKALKLSMSDFSTLISTAFALAIGEDPDAEQTE